MANLLSLAYLFALLALVCRDMYPALARTWFFSSDEYVVVAEVIRFSGLDFHQHFFDMPGTPFIVLNAVIWLALYGGACVVGLASLGTGVVVFSLEHISALFILLRATTLASFLLSAVLLFVVMAKVSNKAAAALAAMLLLLSPIYSSYSSFVRVESLAMVLMLGAVLWLLRGVDRYPEDAGEPPRLRDFTIVAGILAGLAGGVRLHSLGAAVPILVMLLWAHRPVTRRDYPAWILIWAKPALPISWAAAALAFVLARALPAQYAGAVTFISNTAGAWVSLSLFATLLYLFPRTRPFVVRAIGPDVIKLFLGSGAGLLLGIPTILTQGKFFLLTLQMYSGYLDWDRMDWPFWRHLAWYVGHYIRIFAPDTITLCLLALGVLAILLTRDHRMLPFLVAAILFFASKPLSLRPASHHAILWLPFFVAVSAYPVGKAFEWISARGPRGARWGTIALAIFLWFTFQHLTPGPKNATANAMAVEERLRNVERATAWFKTNAEAGATVAIAYSCFNPDVFYAWLRALEVPLPPSVSDGREYVIWWGHGSALKGKAGYACVNKSDVVSMKTLDHLSPGESTDPYSDPRFRHLASFGSGPSQIDLLRFDYRR